VTDRPHQGYLKHLINYDNDSYKTLSESHLCLAGNIFDKSANTN